MSTAQPTPTVDHAFMAGDRDALKLAYEAHGATIYGLCRRTLPAPLAEEVTQDVFVSAWRKRDQFDPSKGSLIAWLVGIAKFRIIDHLRAERRHADRRADLPATETVTPADPTAASSQDSGVPDADGLADRLIVADALRSLPERPREVIELAYVHDLTHAEIAERTGIPLGTIKSDIRRGLATIRNVLEPHHG